MQQNTFILLVFLSIATTVFGQADDCNCDIVLLLDVSSSINDQEFDSLKKFTKLIANSVNLRDDAARLAVIEYSEQARTVLSLSSNKATVLKAIDDFTKPKNVGTYADTGLAIRTAVDELNKRSNPKRCRTIKIITDGFTSDQKASAAVAQQAKNLGIVIVVVGVGPLAATGDARAEYNALATAPLEQNAVVVEDFDISLTQIANYWTGSCLDPDTDNDDQSDCECDVMLVLDASKSLQDEEFEAIKKFASIIVTGHTPFLGPTKAKMGIVTFSQHAKVDVAPTHDAELLHAKISSLKKSVGSTNTADALKLAEKELLRLSRAGPRKCQTVKVVTDGKSDDTAATAEAAYLLKTNDGVKVLAIGIGPNVDLTEMTALASKPYSKNRFQFDTFKGLVDLGRNISDTCTPPADAPKPPPPKNISGFDECLCDVVMVLDTSGSIHDEDWANILKWLHGYFAVPAIQQSLSPKGLRFSVIHFGDHGHVMTDMTHDLAKIRGSFDLIPPPTHESTNSGEGLELARRQFLDHTPEGKCKIVNFVTDGQSTIPEKTGLAAAGLKKLNDISIFALGIGANAANETELALIKTEMEIIGTRYLYLEDFDHLTSGLLAPQHCLEPTPSPVPKDDPPANANDKCSCDIFLVLDASGSVFPEDWVRTQDFSRIIVNGLAPSLELKKTRIGIITFGDDAILELPLSNDPKALLATIDNMQKTEFGSTPTALALSLAGDEFRKNTKPGDCKTIKLVTDGQSDNRTDTIARAHWLKAHDGISIFSVGIGWQVTDDPDEMTKVATPPSAQNSIMLEDFKKLEQVGHLIAEKCSDAIPPPVAVPVAPTPPPVAAPVAPSASPVAPVAPPTPKPEDPIECENCDYILVVDRSGSISDEAWDNNILKFLRIIIDGLSTHFSPTGTRLGIVSYGDEAKLELEITHDVEKMRAVLSKMKRPTDESTHTTDGIRVAVNELMNKTRGMGKCKTMKIITDGASNNATETALIAKEAHGTDGIKVLALGVGSKDNDEYQKELNLLATPPLDKNMIHLDDFTGLEQVGHAIVDKCSEPPPMDDCACDIALVMDSSGSILEDQWPLMKDWLNVIIRGMKAPLTAGDVRLALFNFDDEAHLVLKMTNDSQALLNAVNGLKKSEHGGTRTELGLALAAKHLVETQRSPNSCKAIKILTDGQSDFGNLTAQAAFEIKRQGINVMAIGVGHDAKYSELSGIASAPTGKNAILLKEFSGLDQLAHSISDKCGAKYNLTSSCEMKSLMECIIKKVSDDPCGELDSYSECSTVDHCPDVLKIWCFTHFTQGDEYKKCGKLTEICKTVDDKRCDMGYYQECYDMMNNVPDVDECTRMNHYIWCASAAVCGDLTRYLCAKHAGPIAGVPAGCKLTSCEGIRFEGMDTSAFDHIFNHGSPHAKKTTTTHATTIVLVGVVVALVAAIVLVSAKIRRTRRDMLEGEATQELLA